MISGLHPAFGLALSIVEVLIVIYLMRRFAKNVEKDFIADESITFDQSKERYSKGMSPLAAVFVLGVVSVIYHIYLIVSNLPS